MPTFDFWGHDMKTSVRVLIALATASLLTACATPAQHQAYNAELARSQAVAAAFHQYYSTQQIINNWNRPTVAYCNTNRTSTGDASNAPANCLKN